MEKNENFSQFPKFLLPNTEKKMLNFQKRKIILHRIKHGLWPPTCKHIPFRFGRFRVTVQTFIKPFNIYQQAPACSYY